MFSSFILDVSVPTVVYSEKYVYQSIGEIQMNVRFFTFFTESLSEQLEPRKHSGTPRTDWGPADLLRASQTDCGPADVLACWEPLKSTGARRISWS